MVLPKSEVSSGYERDAFIRSTTEGRGGCQGIRGYDDWVAGKFYKVERAGNRTGPA